MESSRMTSSISDSSTDKRQLLNQLNSIALSGIVDAFAECVGRFDDVLFDRAETAGASHVLFLQGMRELRRKQDEIQEQFSTHLKSSWQAMLDRRPLSADEIIVSGLFGGGGNDLTIITDQQLESQLAVRHFSDTIYRHCKGPVARLEPCLAKLTGLDELDQDRNPIGPHHLGAAIHCAFLSCELSPEICLILIKECERDLLEPLKTLYSTIENFLVESNLLPEKPSVSRPSEQGDSSNAQENDISKILGVLDEFPSQSAKSDTWAMSVLNRWQDSYSQASPDSNQGEVREPIDPMQLFDALHVLLQHARGQQNALSPPDNQHSRRSLSQREMLSVLSSLQATSASLTTGVGSGSLDDSLADRLKNEVFAYVGQLGVDPNNTQLDPIDENTIDLVGMLFGVMLDERDLPGKSRQLISRLAVPFVKVALLDRKMFAQKNHPARRLLNTLAQACEGNAGQSPSERVLMAKVEEVIERLVADFNENLAIFATLEEEFCEFLDHHHRRVHITEKRAAESQRGQEKLHLARQRAQAELEKRLSAVDGLPHAIDAFLCQPWLHHLTMVLLIDEDTEAEVKVVLDLADHLLAAFIQAQRLEENDHWLTDFYPELKHVFASVGLFGEAAYAAIKALENTLNAVARSRPDLEQPLPDLPQVTLLSPLAESNELDVDVDSHHEPAEAENVKQFRELPIGSWLDFLDRNSKVQAGKLSWISPISRRLLFVNRRGVRFRVASPEELAVMHRLGRVRPHVEDDAFDSAISGLIHRLDPQTSTVH